MVTVCTQMLSEDSCIAFAGSQGNFELNAMRPIIINIFLHSARILGDACTKLREYCIEGIQLHREQIDRFARRSLMLVTALAPVVGYDQASAIANKANDEGTTLGDAALALGVDPARFDRVVDPDAMVGDPDRDLGLEEHEVGSGLANSKASGAIGE